MSSNSVTATPQNPFARVESGDLLFLTNGFRFSTDDGSPTNSFITWTTEVQSGGSGDCRPGLSPIHSVKMRYLCKNLDGDANGTPTNSFVKAFPCIVLGSMFGRWETAGVPCATTPTLAGIDPGLRRSNRPRGAQKYHRDSPVFDLNACATRLRYPSKLSDLPETEILFDIASEGDGIENSFIDMYLHDVGDSFRIVGGWPGGKHNGINFDPTPGEVSLLHTINGINANITKDWNCNIWLRVPFIKNGNNDDSDGNWTGGELIGSTTIGGRNHDVYYKIETAGGNNFDYIGLVMNPGVSRGSIQIHKYMEFMQQTLPGMINGSAQASAIYNSPRPTGRSKPRMPDANHVLCGVHMGNEIWRSSESGGESSVTYHQLQINIESNNFSRTLGWNGPGTAGPNPVPPPYPNSIDNPPPACLNPTVNIVAGQQISLQPSQIHPQATAILNVVSETNPSVSSVVSQVPSLVVKGNNAGDNVITLSLNNGSTCTAHVNVQPAQDDGGAGACQSPARSITVGQNATVTPAEIAFGATSITALTSETAPSVANITNLQPNLVARGTLPGTTEITVDTNVAAGCKVLITVT